MDQPLNLRRKYIHISSNHRFQESHDEAKLQVHMQNALKNVHSVAVKQFSMASAMHNIRTGDNELSWLEVYKYDGDENAIAQVFTIKIPVGYYEASTLCQEINAQIALLPSRKLSADVNEAASELVFSQDPGTYQIQISLKNSGTGTHGVKYFQPIHTPFTFWNRLGFSESQLRTRGKRKRTSEYVSDDAMDIGEAETAAESVVIPANMTLMGYNTFYMLVSQFPTHIESDAGVYLCSDALTKGGGTFETTINQDNLHVVARPVNILEWVQFDQARFSFVNYNAKMPHLHFLNEASVQDFDISLRSAHGKPLKIDECGHFNIVLMVETLEHDEITADFIKKYNEEGYALAHQKDRIKLNLN